MVISGPQYPWLIAIGGAFCYGLYYLLKNHLVRRFIEPLVQKPAADMVVYHGPGREGEKTHFMESKERRTLSDGEVARISAELVSNVVCTTTALVGLFVMWETADDVIHSKSTVLVPFVHLIAWYFVYDLYALCEGFSLRKLPREATFLQRWTTFVWKQGSGIVIHHLLLLGVGIPLAAITLYFILQAIKNWRSGRPGNEAMNYSWRRGIGDFVIGSFLIRDFSNPFVNTAQILNILNLKKTFLFKVNGIIAIITFFVLRIINWPLVLLVYAYQHFQLDILATLKSLSPFCYVGMTAELALEMYWFSKILIIAFGSWKSMKRA